MKTKYKLKRVQSELRISHGLAIYERVLKLYINNKCYRIFREGTIDCKYYNGPHFYGFVVVYIERLRKFFPGSLKIKNHKLLARGEKLQVNMIKGISHDY